MNTTTTDEPRPILIEFGKTSVRVPHRLRVQRRRVKGEPGMPEGAVYVGRPSRFGNPFAVSRSLDIGYQFTSDLHARRFVVTCFAEWLTDPRQDHWSGPAADQRRAAILDSLREIRGKRLACWCPLDRPCHADVLAVLANP